MKKIILLLSSLTIMNIPCFAFEPKYSVHTSNKDIEAKKKDALIWYDINKHIGVLKNKALTWYKNQITEQKDYFKNPNKELDFKKKKALTWYEKNSQ